MMQNAKKRGSSMVNEKKIILMTKLASYEMNQGKKDLEITQRLKNDYISYNGFINCVLVTIALIIILGADFAAEFIGNMATFTEFDFVGVGINYLAIWLFAMVVYGFISGRIYRNEYNEAYTRVKEYEKDLKALEQFSKSK
jgi:hypothetical protein